MFQYPSPSPQYLNSEIEPMSPALQADSLLSEPLYMYMLVSLKSSSSELPERLYPGPQYSVRFQNKSDAHSSQMHTVNFLFQSTKLRLGRGIFSYFTSPLVSSSLQDLSLFLIF